MDKIYTTGMTLDCMNEQFTFHLLREGQKGCFGWLTIEFFCDGFAIHIGGVEAWMKDKKGEESCGYTRYFGPEGFSDAVNIFVAQMKSRYSIDLSITDFEVSVMKQVLLSGKMHKAVSIICPGRDIDAVLLKMKYSYEDRLLHPTKRRTLP